MTKQELFEKMIDLILAIEENLSCVCDEGSMEATINADNLTFLLTECEDLAKIIRGEKKYGVPTNIN